MPSINKILTKLGYSEARSSMSDLKIMQKGEMYLGKTGTQILDNLVLTTNNEKRYNEIFEQRWYQLRYSGLKEIQKVHDGVTNCFDYYKKQAKRNISNTYDKDSFIQMYEKRKEDAIYILNRKLEEFAKKHDIFWDSKSAKTHQESDIQLQEMDKARDKYLKTLAQTDLDLESINEIAKNVMERPLNKILKLIGL